VPCWKRIVLLLEVSQTQKASRRQEEGQMCQVDEALLLPHTQKEKRIVDTKANGSHGTKVR
jgi:hypothetical protein